VARNGSIETTPHRRRLRRQDHFRIRYPARFPDFLVRMGVKFDTAPLDVRDAIKHKGDYEPWELEAAAGGGGPPPGEEVWIQMEDAGTDLERLGSELTIVRGDATFVTLGFLDDMLLCLYADGPSFNDSPIELSGFVKSVESETEIIIRMERGGKPVTVETQLGDVVIVAEIQSE